MNDIGELKSIQSVGEGNNQNYRKETTEEKPNIQMPILQNKIK